MLLSRTDRLREQSAENSADSSKPPSGDGLKKKPRTGSLGKPGEKPDGGQPGHKGHYPEMADTPDRIVVRTVRTCGKCHASLKKATVIGHDRRQVSDIPPIRPGITGHRIGILGCPKCGHHNKAEFPKPADTIRRRGEVACGIFQRISSHSAEKNRSDFRTHFRSQDFGGSYCRSMRNLRIGSRACERIYQKTADNVRCRQFR